MDNKDIWYSLSVVILLSAAVLGSGYASYKYGRHVERRDLTRLFMQMTSDTYFEGYSDGQKEGARQAKADCVDEDGRY